MELLRAQVEWTRAPACVAMVYDSDMADVIGLAPDGREWRAVLNLEIAAENVDAPASFGGGLTWFRSPGYEQAVDRRRDELDAAVVTGAQGAAAWAAAAGFIPAGGQVAIEELLRSEETFVEAERRRDRRAWKDRVDPAPGPEPPASSSKTTDP